MSRKKHSDLNPLSENTEQKKFTTKIINKDDTE